MKTILLIALLLIAARAIFVLPMTQENTGISERERSGNYKNTAAAQEISSNVFTVRTEEAEIRTLKAYLEVNANIVSGIR